MIPNLTTMVNDMRGLLRPRDEIAHGALPTDEIRAFVRTWLPVVEELVKEQSTRPLVRMPGSLMEWEDVDIASYTLARVLGILPATENEFPVKYKALFSTRNALTDWFADVFNVLENMDVIERDPEDGTRVRWKQYLTQDIYDRLAGRRP